MGCRVIAADALMGDKKARGAQHRRTATIYYTNAKKEEIPRTRYIYVTEEHAMIKRTLAKNALHAAAMIGRLAACAGQ